MNAITVNWINQESLLVTRLFALVGCAMILLSASTIHGQEATPSDAELQAMKARLAELESEVETLTRELARERMAHRPEVIGVLEGRMRLSSPKKSYPLTFVGHVDEVDSDAPIVNIGSDDGIKMSHILVIGQPHHENYCRIVALDSNHARCAMLTGAIPRTGMEVRVSRLWNWNGHKLRRIPNDGGMEPPGRHQ